MARPAAVFFDVDFTLIYPGPRFQGTGYATSCARHGVVVDASRFEAAVAGAADVLDVADQYDADLYVRYTRRIIELMGGRPPGLDAVARELYDAWADHEHFSLYDDAVETLQALRARGVRVGLISNSNRCLQSFQSHFALDGLFAAVVSSAECGSMKPHPAIFREALDRIGAEPGEAVMVGDSLRHDVRGAVAVGMRAVLVARGTQLDPVDAGVEVIRALRELPDRLEPRD